MRRFSCLLGALVLVAAMASCGDDDDDASTADESADVCASLVVLGQDVAALHDLTATSTVQDLQEARDAVKADVEALQEERGDLVATQVDALQTAFDDFADSLEAINDTESLASAAPDVVAAAAALRQATTTLATDSQCTLTTTTTAG